MKIITKDKIYENVKEISFYNVDFSAIIRIDITLEDGKFDDIEVYDLSDILIKE